MPEQPPQNLTSPKVYHLATVPKPRPPQQYNGGRPSKRTAEMDRKIEEAAALGATIEEIAFYCGVHRATVYQWVKDDRQLHDRIEALHQRPILKARQTLVKSLDDPETAKWYLERKQKREFALRTEVTGADGKALLDPSDDEKKKLDSFLNGQPIHQTIAATIAAPALSQPAGVPAAGNEEDDGRGQQPAALP